MELEAGNFAMPGLNALPIDQNIFETFGKADDSGFPDFSSGFMFSNQFKKPEEAASPHGQDHSKKLKKGLKPNPNVSNAVNFINRYRYFKYQILHSFIL